MRRRKKRTQDDFQETLQARAASHCEHRAWRVNTADSLEEEREAQESQQEKDREMHQDIMGLIRHQTQTLQTLVDLQVQQSRARLPLHPTENSILGPSYTPSTSHVASGVSAVPRPLHPSRQ
ncbi:unnamed protein product [Caretta caretta]